MDDADQRVGEAQSIARVHADGLEDEGVTDVAGRDVAESEHKGPDSTGIVDACEWLEQGLQVDDEIADRG